MQIETVRKILSQYKSKNLKFKLHVFFRTILCPFDRIESYVPREINSILDLGCGYGIWLNYLALLGKKTKMIGVDIDKNKIIVAKSSVNKMIQFINSDMLNFNFNNIDIDCITIIDSMYLIPYEKQFQLLFNCYKALKPGGYIIIKETDVFPDWKHRWNRVQEFISVKILKITHGRGFYWRNKGSFINMFNQTNFRDIITKRIDEGYAHPHILYIAKK